MRRNRVTTPGGEDKQGIVIKNNNNQSTTTKNVFNQQKLTRSVSSYISENDQKIAEKIEN